MKHICSLHKHTNNRNPESEHQEKITKHTHTHTEHSWKIAICFGPCCHCPHCPGSLCDLAAPASRGTPGTLPRPPRRPPPRRRGWSPPPGGRCTAIRRRARRGRRCPPRCPGAAELAPTAASASARRRGCQRRTRRQMTRRCLPGWRRLRGNTSACCYCSQAGSVCKGFFCLFVSETWVNLMMRNQKQLNDLKIYIKKDLHVILNPRNAHQWLILKKTRGLDSVSLVMILVRNPWEILKTENSSCCIKYLTQCFIWTPLILQQRQKSSFFLINNNFQRELFIFNTPQPS